MVPRRAATSSKSSDPEATAQEADRPPAARKTRAKTAGNTKAKTASGATSARSRSARAGVSVAETLADRKAGSLILVIAEKPSVARDIARAMGRQGDKLKTHQGYLLGDRYAVTWAIGHLLELAEPEDYSPSLKRWRLEDLPIIPAKFVLKPIPRTKSQLDTVISLLRCPAFAEVVNACDAGREGELIFRHLMEAAEVRLPVKRLWISAMTDEAILEGLAALRDGGEFETLEAAARCRNESDWLVGINATRGMTKKCGVLLSVGRVQTPTLALLAERENEIKAFVPEKYWEVEAVFSLQAAGVAAVGEPVIGAAEPGAGPTGYRGLWFSPDAPDGRLRDPDRASLIAARTAGRPGTVDKVEKKRKSQMPPLLYDLTQLQRDMNRRHGFSASRTLSLAQDLYEKYKVLTYPRTDSRFLSGKVVPLLPSTVRAVAEVSEELTRAAGPFLAVGGRMPISGRQVNDARVRDHHAIIPTPKAADGSKLRGDHRKVFDAVAKRFLAAFYPAAVLEDTTVVTLVEGETFRTKGRVVVEKGWLEVEEAGWLTRPAAAEGEDSGQAETLPALAEGQAVETMSSEAVEKETRPPARYTEASLLQAMETCGKLVDDEELQEAMKEKGIGTPATRAAIIERLIEVGYVERDRRSLIATPKGVELVANIPTRDLVSPALTGAWEAKLREVEKGSLTRPDFMGEIQGFVGRIVEDVRALDSEGLSERMRRTLGKCPRCGADVVENRKAFACSRWNDKGNPCTFTIWKVIAGRPIRAPEAAMLIEKGRTYLLRGFRSRAGRRFPAFLVLTDEGVKFEFPERKAAGNTGGRAGGRGAGAVARGSGRGAVRTGRRSASRAAADDEAAAATDLTRES